MSIHQSEADEYLDRAYAAEGVVATQGKKIDEMCDDVFRLEGIVADRDRELADERKEIVRLNAHINGLDAKITDMSGRCDHLELVNSRQELKIESLKADVDDVFTQLEVSRHVVANRDELIAVLEDEIEAFRRETVSAGRELSRKQEVIESQLQRIEQLDNQLQNKLCDISALEDTMSDRDTVRRSVKFNAVHMLQSAIAVLNGL